MKLLVTGGCGYKGSVLIPLLLADGHSVISIDTQWFGNALPEHPQLTNLKLDVRDTCLLYTSPSPRDQRGSRMPSSA